MNNKSLFIYFVLLILLCTGFIIGARMMGQQGVYLPSGIPEFLAGKGEG
jgi:hypothetical protein